MKFLVVKATLTLFMSIMQKIYMQCQFLKVEAKEDVHDHQK